MSLTQTDDTFVCDVVDRLKKQGLFDQFRKECLADVDTKPAYQNLQMKVHGAVNSFLSLQKWRPDLNKNQLRESLRKHLTDLPMLSIGVDRVVDQVVNPKIEKDFKPQIDKIICEHLGLDYEQWVEKQNAQEQRLANPNIGSNKSIPSLLDIETGFSKRVGSGNNLLKDAQNIGPAAAHPSKLSNSVGILGNGPRGPLLNTPIGIPPAQLGPVPDRHIPPPRVGSMPMGMNNMPVGMPNPADAMTYTQPPVMPYGMAGAVPYEYDPHFYEYSSYGKYPGAVYPSPIMPFPPHMQPGLAPGFDIPGINVIEGVFPPLHQVPSETNLAANITETQKAKDRKKRKKEAESITVEDLLNVPLPKSTQESKAKENKKVEGVVEKSTPPVSQESVVVDPTNAVVEEKNVREIESTNETIKEYHFAWDDVDVTNISVSSVHSSDLSSFEDDEDAEGMESPDEDQDKDDGNEKSVNDNTDVPSDMNEIDTVDNVKEIRSELDKVEKKKSKSHVSDSEVEETKEERRKRLTDEKEERYLRRQKRRAELDSKQKEKEEDVNASKKQEKTEAKESVPEKDEVNKSENASVEEVANKVDAPQDAAAEIEAEEAEMKEEKETKPADVGTPQKPRRRRTKKQMKEELREKKVMEKKRELTRQRTMNRKYLSEDFTSVFTEKKELLSSSYSSEVVIESVVEQTVEIDESGNCVMEYMDGIDSANMATRSQSSWTQDESSHNQSFQDMEMSEVTVGSDYTSGVEVPSGNKAAESNTSGSRPTSPYSNISDDSSEDSVVVLGVQLAQKTVRKESKRREHSSHKSSENRRRKKKHRSSHRRSPSTEAYARTKKRAKCISCLPVEPNQPANLQRYDTSDLYKPRTSWRKPPETDPPSPIILDAELSVDELIQGHRSNVLERPSHSSRRRDVTVGVNSPAKDILQQQSNLSQSGEGSRQSFEARPATRLQSNELAEDWHPKMNVDEVNFGEAARRASRFADEADRGHRPHGTGHRQQWQQPNRMMDVNPMSRDSRAKHRYHPKKSNYMIEGQEHFSPYRHGGSPAIKPSFVESWEPERSDHGSHHSRERSSSSKYGRSSKGIAEERNEVIEKKIHSRTPSQDDDRSSHSGFVSQSGGSPERRFGPTELNFEEAMSRSPSSPVSIQRQVRSLSQVKHSKSPGEMSTSSASSSRSKPFSSDRLESVDPHPAGGWEVPPHQSSRSFRQATEDIPREHRRQSRHVEEPLRHVGEPSRQAGELSRHPGEPLRHSREPSRHAGEPSRHAGELSRHPGEPLRHSREPSRHAGEPSRHAGEPLKHSGEPSRHSGEPSRHSGEPSRHAGEPMRRSQALRYHPSFDSSGRPSRPPGHWRNEPVDYQQRPGRVVPPYVAQEIMDDESLERTRAGQRKCEEDKAPIAKRLRR